MEIRSVTFLVDPTLPLDGVAAAAADSRAVLAEAGYRLQTVRLATTPFPTWLVDLDQVADLAEWCRHAGIDYLALGPVRLGDDGAHLAQLPAVFAAQEGVFASAEIANRSGLIDLGRIGAVAALVRQLSRLQADGFANVYFAATANCPPGSPFFPVAYHRGGPGCFAIGTEAADLAVTAFGRAGSLDQARADLVEAIEREAARLVRVADFLARRHTLSFGGIDFSLAPYPEAERSLGAALEALGVPAAGGHGSLFAAAFVAECVDRARFPRCGFSGLMFPVLEDAILARRASEGVLTVSDLLLYSAVCGAGLDTVPLAGDVSVGELAGILLDLAALAVRLNKPLTARLMPLPGLAPGDPVTFDFSYFADSRTMATKGGGVTGVLRGQESLVLATR